MILFEKREQKEKRFRLCEKYDILFFETVASTVSKNMSDIF